MDGIVFMKRVRTQKEDLLKSGRKPTHLILGYQYALHAFRNPLTSMELTQTGLKVVVIMSYPTRLQLLHRRNRHAYR
jgi:hypothetical protein